MLMCGCMCVALSQCQGQMTRGQRCLVQFASCGSVDIPLMETCREEVCEPPAVFAERMSGNTQRIILMRFLQPYWQHMVACCLDPGPMGKITSRPGALAADVTTNDDGVAPSPSGPGEKRPCTDISCQVCGRSGKDGSECEYFSRMHMLDLQRFATPCENGGRGCSIGEVGDHVLCIC